MTTSTRPMRKDGRRQCCAGFQGSVGWRIKEDILEDFCLPFFFLSFLPFFPPIFKGFGFTEPGRSISNWMTEYMSLGNLLNFFRLPLQFSSDQSLSCVRLCHPVGCSTPGLPFHHCPSPVPGTCSNSCPSSRWYHLTISVFPFSSCFQSFPASRSFPLSQFFTSCGQSIGASASASASPMNIQD